MSQADELNGILEGSVAHKLLSKRGKEIYFPKRGILKQAADAKGKMINATIGQAIEDDGGPMHLESIAKNIILPPKQVFPYAPSYGLATLRKKWLELIKNKNPSLNGETSLPIVTNGLTHAIQITAYLFVNEGDKIILPDKFWGNYKLIFKNGFGGALDTFKMFENDEFNIDALNEKLKGEEKKILLLNFPNNPTGYTPTAKEAEEISRIIEENAEDKPILVLCDDAYFGLIYRQNIYKESIFARIAHIHDNVLAVKIDGATKEDYAWGLRVGFITYGNKSMTKEQYDAMEEKTSGTIRGTLSNVSHLSQSLVLEAFKSENYKNEKEKMYDKLRERFEMVDEVLKYTKYQEYFRALPYNSGYFMCIELKKDAEKVRQKLLEKYSTGVIAIGNLLRIAFSCVPKGKIPELFENIYHACKEV